MKRIAIVTMGYKGLDDELSDVFAKAPTITLIELDVENRKYRLLEIFENEAISFSHGAGPILIKVLLDRKVDIAIGPKVGIGTRELLKEKRIKFLEYSPGIKVSEIIQNILEESHSI